jgi:transposase
VQSARQHWRNQQPHWDIRHLVFIDETGLNTKMARLYGRAPVGERCVSSVPHGHWGTSTFLAALRHDCVTAPLLVDGAMDGPMFLGYVEQSLCRELKHGDIVICDNLSCHKVRGVREAIESCGAQIIYLPPYSPDLNPIEMFFAKLKAALRNACARTLASLQEATAAALDTFTPEHCTNFFKNAQYASY